MEWSFIIYFSSDVICSFNKSKSCLIKAKHLTLSNHKEPNMKWECFFNMRMILKKREWYLSDENDFIRWEWFYQMRMISWKENDFMNWKLFHEVRMILRIKKIIFLLVGSSLVFSIISWPALQLCFQFVSNISLTFAHHQCASKVNKKCICICICICICF